MKWFGKVGYGFEKETSPGVYEIEFIEREYYGDVTNLYSRWVNSENLNDETKIDCKISIIADQFAYEKFPFIKYVEYMGHLWKVSDISPNRPRLALTLGGLYNGQ